LQAAGHPRRLRHGARRVSASSTGSAADRQAAGRRHVVQAAEGIAVADRVSDDSQLIAGYEYTSSCLPRSVFIPYGSAAHRRETADRHVPTCVCKTAASQSWRMEWAWSDKDI
jgi:hypothetical protein